MITRTIVEKTLYVVMLLLGAVFASSFFADKAVDVQFPLDRFRIVCGILFGGSFFFKLVDELLERYLKQLSWLSTIAIMLSLFFLSAASVRLVYMLLKGESVFSDPVVVGLFSVGVSAGLGIALAKLLIKVGRSGTVWRAAK